MLAQIRNNCGFQAKEMPPLIIQRGRFSFISCFSHLLFGFMQSSVHESEIVSEATSNGEKQDEPEEKIT
jgi:hypothetical protein